jgi:formate dehydrogenase subunit delta
MNGPAGRRETGSDSTVRHLEKMANDIAHFFSGQGGREAAIDGIANHIRSFWTPQMQEKLIEQLRFGKTTLEELPREALRRLSENGSQKPVSAPGGDAG